MLRKTTAQITEKAQAVRAGGAERMRRSRVRKGKGARCYTLELFDYELAALVRHGFLRVGEQSDRAAVINAMYAFLNSTLGRPA